LVKYVELILFLVGPYTNPRIMHHLDSFFVWYARYGIGSMHWCHLSNITRSPEEKKSLLLFSIYVGKNLNLTLVRIWGALMEFEYLHTSV